MHVRRVDRLAGVLKRGGTRAVAVRRCKECGAELRHDLDNCPLCGADAAARAPRRAAASTNVEDYQRDIRKLRERLKKLRDGGAEAV